MNGVNFKELAVDLRKQLDAQRLRADTAEAELAEKIRDEVNLKIIVEAAKNNHEELRESRDSFQRVGIQAMEKLAAAEQRIADTVAKLQLAADMLDDDERGNRFAQVLQLAMAALNPNPNPNPEAESQ